MEETADRRGVEACASPSGGHKIALCSITVYKLALCFQIQEIEFWIRAKDFPPQAGRIPRCLQGKNRLFQALLSCLNGMKKYADYQTIIQLFIVSFSPSRMGIYSFRKKHKFIPTKASETFFMLEYQFGDTTAFRTFVVEDNAATLPVQYLYWWACPVDKHINLPPISPRPATFATRPMRVLNPFRISVPEVHR